MKILVLKGSPHINGTTSFLSDVFCCGLKESGHEVISIDTAKLNINSCLGCNHCRKHNGKCVHDDDMIDIISKLLNADAVVLVSPLYYFGMTAQLKTVIDRFYSVNSLLKESHKKLYLIAAATNTYNWTMDGIETHYKTLCKYLNWEEGGSLLCYGLSTRHAAENSEYKEKAREFGRKLK